jgi:L-alanine-DL-glutamate epimerase-like enolase superfamily enzyme
VRRAVNVPVASLESIYGRRAYRAFRERYAVDVAIVDVPWKDDLVTVAPTIEAGEMLLPTAPDWGTDVNEEAVRAHSWH